MLIKIQPDATVCSYLFTAKLLYMFRVSQHPSSGVLKTVTSATFVQRGPIGPRWTKVAVEQKRNVMAHAQKPDLVFQRNGRVHLYRPGCQFSRLLAAEVCASAVVMLDRPCPILCTTAGYPLHSPFSPSLLHPCVSVCHHIQFLLYQYYDLYLRLRLQFLVLLMMGAVTPETCRAALQ